MNILNDILPYVGVIGISVYFIIRQNRMAAMADIYLRIWKAIASTQDKNSARLFRETLSEKELKKIGFTEDEVNRIIGAKQDVLMEDIIPHYSKYIN